jgi:hypothetical protein
MGYFQFTITLKSGEHLHFIRQLPAKDLDQVWRSHELKAKDHYKSKLLSFRVVQLSKVDPEIKKWISDQGKPETKAMDDLLNQWAKVEKLKTAKRNPVHRVRPLVKTLRDLILIKSRNSYCVFRKNGK